LIAAATPGDDAAETRRHDLQHVEQDHAREEDADLSEAKVAGHWRGQEQADGYRGSKKTSVCDGDPEVAGRDHSDHADRADGGGGPHDRDSPARHWPHRAEHECRKGWIGERCAGGCGRVVIETALSQLPHRPLIDLEIRQPVEKRTTHSCPHLNEGNDTDGNPR
jgi:hypothetical protein